MKANSRSKLADGNSRRVHAAAKQTQTVKARSARRPANAADGKDRHGAISAVTARSAIRRAKAFRRLLKWTFLKADRFLDKLLEEFANPLANTICVVAGYALHAILAPSMAPPAKPSALLDTRVIYCGDNLEQLRKLPDACVDLIYIAPPFNSNRNYEVFWGETKEQ